MSRADTRVRLVEDSYGDVVLAQRALELDGGERFEPTIAGTLGDGMERLAQGFHAILLDVTLPDSVGPETTRMRAAAHDLAIVVLFGARTTRTSPRAVCGREPMDTSRRASSLRASCAT